MYLKTAHKATLLRFHKTYNATRREFVCAALAEYRAAKGLEGFGEVNESEQTGVLWIKM